MGVIIKALGHFIPNKVIHNEELAKRFSISEQWIEERTGIVQRYYFEDGATSDLIVKAVEMLLDLQEVDKSLIDCIIVATITPDHQTPSTAALVQKKLSFNHCFAFDISAACSGFIYGLELATALINSRKYNNILVIGADKMSSIIDPKDRKTSLILGDGAGCCLLSYSELENNIIDSICYLDSTHLEAVTVPNGGSYKPINSSTFEEQNHFLRFTDKRIFEIGIELFSKIILEILEKNKISIEEIDLIVPHQANKRMIEELAKRLNISIDKFFINIEYIGNTSAATIPIALSQASQQNKLTGKVLLASVGAGFAYSASILNLNQNYHG